jgi:tRNA-dihydrouridine synthase 1
MDAVMRRYMDIIHKYALGQQPPARKPLWMPGDPEVPPQQQQTPEAEDEGPPKKKQKQMSKAEKKKEKTQNPNLTAMQAHLFHLLRPLVAEHHNVRDALARSRTGDIDAFENVLTLVENAVKQGIMAYESQPTPDTNSTPASSESAPTDPYESSLATVARCKRPYWVCQPYVRPLPKEAIEKGSMTVSKKERKRLEEEAARDKKENEAVGLEPGGRVEKTVAETGKSLGNESLEQSEGKSEKENDVVEEPKEGVVCG